MTEQKLLQSLWEDLPSFKKNIPQELNLPQKVVEITCSSTGNSSQSTKPAIFKSRTTYLI